jgi:hypothetical protein
MTKIEFKSFRSTTQKNRVPRKSRPIEDFVTLQSYRKGTSKQLIVGGPQSKLKQTKMIVNGKVWPSVDLKTNTLFFEWTDGYSGYTIRMVKDKKNRQLDGFSIHLELPIGGSAHSNPVTLDAKNGRYEKERAKIKYEPNRISVNFSQIGELKIDEKTVASVIKMEDRR